MATQLAIVVRILTCGAEISDRGPLLDLNLDLHRTFTLLWAVTHCLPNACRARNPSNCGEDLFLVSLVFNRILGFDYSQDLFIFYFWRTFNFLVWIFNRNLFSIYSGPFTNFLNVLLDPTTFHPPDLC